MKAKDLDESYTFIARKDTWYKEGTEAELIAHCSVAGLFRGWLLVTEDHPNDFKKLRGVGDENWDEEMCGWEEFDIYKDGQPVEIEDD